MPKQRKAALHKITGKPYHTDDKKTARNPGSRKKSKTTLQSKKLSSSFAEDLVEELRKEFQKAANPKKAVGMKKYMRNQFDFFGLQYPVIRLISKQVVPQFGIPDFKNLESLLLLLWQQREREFQVFGVDYATDHFKVLSTQGADALQGCIKTLLTNLSWWDTVDALVSGVVGRMVQAHPVTCVAVMEEWIESDNMWLRRSAILHQLKFKEDTDQERLFRFCLKCSHEKEFFIRKAIGWALRQYHKTKPKDVQTFVQKNQDNLATLSIREALKHA